MSNQIQAEPTGEFLLNAVFWHLKVKLTIQFDQMLTLTI